MKLTIEDAENQLKAYYDATREKRDAIKDLDAAVAAYKSRYDGLYPSGNLSAVRTKTKSISDPTARTVMLIIQTCQADIDKAESRLAKAKRDIDRIERIVDSAKLIRREREYIRIRYFEGHSAESTAIKMEVSYRTSATIRIDALTKVLAVLQAESGKTSENGAQDAREVEKAV